MTSLFLAGLLALAVIAVADVVGGVRHRLLPPAGYLLGAAASACLLTAGAFAVAGHGFVIDLDDALGFGPSTLAADRLSGLFLVIAFGAATLVSLALASWSARPAGSAGGASAPSTPCASAPSL